MSKDIKKALEHCIEWNCADCPNREELGSGETVCRGRLLPYVLEYVSDLETKLADLQQEQVKEMQEHQETMHVADNTIKMLEKALELACKWTNDIQEMDSDCPIYADCFRVEKDCDNWDCGNCDCSKFAIDHFKTKAKELMKSE